MEFIQESTKPALEIKMKARDFMSPIHVIAINQVIDSPRGKVPNPNITDWVVQVVDGNINIAMIHKRVEDGKYELTSDFGRDFGSGVFASVIDARDWVEQQYMKRRLQ